MSEMIVPNQIGGALVSATPMDILARAVSAGTAPDVLERIMDAAERYDRWQARKAFSRAMADAMAEIEPIERNRSVGFKTKAKDDRPAGWKSYKHASLAQVDRSCRHILAKHGLHWRWNTSNPDVGKPIRIVCIISHRDGHHEENELCGSPDPSGDKNPIQAIGSAATYLERYTLMAGLGLSSGDDDDDGRGGKTINERPLPPDPSKPRAKKEKPAPGTPHDVDANDAKEWHDAFLAAVMEATTVADVNEFLLINAPKLAVLGETDRGLYADVQQEVIRHRASLAEAAAPIETSTEKHDPVTGELPPDPSKPRADYRLKELTKLRAQIQTLETVGDCDALIRDRDYYEKRKIFDAKVQGEIDLAILKRRADLVTESAKK